MKIEGGCLCGKVRYSADTEPAFVGVCHCTNCQKATGTAFNVVVALPARRPTAGSARNAPRRLSRRPR